MVLPTETAAVPLTVVDEIGSTSDALIERAGQGAGPQALMTRRQTAGRGRRGRTWVGSDGNLFLSILLRPAQAVRPGHWSLLSAVALADAVAADLAPPFRPLLRLKWPNDVVLAGGKLAGILLDAGFDHRPWLVMGFGVNLATQPPGVGRAIATLADFGPVPAAEAFAQRLLGAVSRWQAVYEQAGFPPLREAWLRDGHRPGDQLTVDGGRVTGTFHGLGDDGALQLLDAGVLRTLTAGEVGAG